MEREMEGTKDYAVEVTVKNNLLLKAMIEEGYNTAAELARASGINNGAIGQALNLKAPLYLSDGEFSSIWLRLSKFLRRLPEDLLPEQHHNQTLETNKFRIEANMEELASGQYISKNKDLEQLTFDSDCKKVAESSLLMLNPREERVVRLIFGIGCREHKQYEIAELLGISASRVMQIKDKAKRKLEDPSRKRAAWDLLGEP